MFDDGFTTLVCADCTGDHCNVSIDIGQRFRGQAKKAHTSLENLSDCFLLIRHGSDYQVGMCRKNLPCIRGPGIAQDSTRGRCQFANNIGSIFGAGDDEIELSDGSENKSSAGLQTGDAAGHVRRRHSYGRLFFSAAVSVSIAN